MSLLSFIVFLAGLICLASAHHSSYSTTPTSTSTSSTPTHTISVGKDGFAFTPSQVTAEVGDIIEYLFYPQNHSVARAEWKSPCIPYEYTDLNKKGFYSGFTPITFVVNEPPRFQVRVNDTEPIFFYCSAPGACLLDGMIGVVNPTAEKNFDDQLKFAKNASLMFSPGQIVPEIRPNVSTASSSSPTSTTTMTPEDTAAAAVSKSATSSGPSLSTGSIIGISLGGTALLLAVATLLYICGRKRSLGGLLRTAPSQPSLHPYYPSSSPSVVSASAYYSPNFRQHGLERSPAHSLPEHRGCGEIGTLSETQRSWSPPFHCDGHNRAPILPMMTPFSPISGTPGSPPSPRSPSTMTPIGQGAGDRTSRTPTYQTFHYPLPLQAGRLYAPQPPPPISQSGPHELGSGRPDSGMDHVIRFNHRDSGHHQAPVVYPQ